MKIKISPIYLIGISIFVPTIMIFSAYQVKAQEPDSTEPQEACGLCHQIIYEHWKKSDHGQATSDESFLAVWDGQDNSCLVCHTTGFEIETGLWEKNGVYCSNCHTPDHGEHPERIMLTDYSSGNCGSCHLETFVDWQQSEHSEVTLNCNNCHNPHTTSLKVDNAQALCQACHREETHAFDIAVHAEQGLLCIDCHLGVERAIEGEGHSKRAHTFVVEAGTCVTCHEDNDNVAGAGLTTPYEPKNPALLNKDSLVKNEPQPVGPLGFAILSILIGLGIGIILSPWIDPWLRKEFQS